MRMVRTVSGAGTGSGKPPESCWLSMHRHGGCTSGQDVYVNVVGGLKITETGSDLAVLLACASSLRGKALPQQLAVFGEVGLSGEIRPVPNGQERLKRSH